MIYFIFGILVIILLQSFAMPGVNSTLNSIGLGADASRNVEAYKIIIRGNFADLSVDPGDAEVLLFYEDIYLSKAKVSPNKNFQFLVDSKEGRYTLRSSFKNHSCVRHFFLTKLQRELSLECEQGK